MGASLAADDRALIRWIVRDVTAQKRAEVEIAALTKGLETRVAERTAALEEERWRLGVLLERLPYGVVAVTDEHGVVFANEEAKRMLGAPDLEQGDALPEPWSELRLASLVDRLYEPEALAFEEDVQPGEGQDFYTVSGMPAGSTGTALLIFHDVSERERAQRAQRDFIANAAHELRTPLAVIASAIEVLQSGAKTAPERDLFLGHIEHEAMRLNRLVVSLLLLARVQSGHELPRAEVIALRPLLEEAAAEVIAPSGVRVTVRCPRSLAVVANRGLTAQALATLVANAGKFTREGRIVLAARRRKDRVAIEVTDTGPGIPQELQNRVLERFYRGAENGSGFGLGLSIASEIVRVLGGELELESNSGRGTRARIMLPAAELIS